MTRRRRKWAVAAAVLPALVLLVFLALDSRLAVRRYTVESEKLSAPLRLALLTDLHNCDYGEGQAELLNALYAQEPDVVLLGGDFIDYLDRTERSLYTLTEITARYPTYYVTGNHEYWSGAPEAVKELIASCGVTLLEGARVPLSVNGQTVALCGIDDAEIGTEETKRQLDAISSGLDREQFSILLAHRPEEIETYLPYGFDLILSGHAHGGQWRIPGLLNGLYAPHQGLFPKYAGGRYDLDGTVFLVSRGLARETTSVPRIFNRPELVVVDLVPAGT